MMLTPTDYGSAGYRDDASKGIAQWERGEMAMRIYVTPVDGYDAEAAKFLGHFEAFVTGEFGDRCSTFDVDCPCCKMWKLYDETKVIVEI